MRLPNTVALMTAAIALSLMHANASAQTSFPVQAPVMLVGDTWSYKVTDLWKKEVAPNLLVQTVSAIDNFIRFTGKSTTGAEFRYGTDKSLDVPYTVDKEAQLNRYFAWPLTETSVWENKRKQKTNNVNIIFESECKVKGAEKITVPAGTFDTVYFVCKGNYNNDNTGAYSPGGGSGYFVEEYWYEPSVKQHVKTTSEYRHGGRLSAQMMTELASFKVQ